MDKVVEGYYCKGNNANYLIHERTLYIYRSVHLSVPTVQPILPMDKLVYRRYGPCRWTRFLRATLCPCNIANYLIHERIVHLPIVYSLHPYRRTFDTDGKLVYHLYRPCRWVTFLRATLCPCNNANYLIHERILHIYRSCIHFSIRTDVDNVRFIGWRTGLPSVPTTDGRFFGATLCPCNNTNFIRERILLIYRSCIHFSIRTDGHSIYPMENWFTIGTDRTDGQGWYLMPLQ